MLIGAVSQGCPHILSSLNRLPRTGASLEATRRWPEEVGRNDTGAGSTPRPGRTRLTAMYSTKPVGL
jgi:hypothetical protein